MLITVCFLCLLVIASCVSKTEPDKNKMNNTMDNDNNADIDSDCEDEFSFPATLVIHGVVHERIGKEELVPYADLREPRVCSSNSDYSGYCRTAEKTLPQDCKKQFPSVPDTWFENNILIVLFLEEAVDAKSIETRLDPDGCLWVFLTVTSKEKWLDGYDERTRLLTTLLIPWEKAIDDTAVHSLKICLGKMWNTQSIIEAMAN